MNEHVKSISQNRREALNTVKNVVDPEDVQGGYEQSDECLKPGRYAESFLWIEQRQLNTVMTTADSEESPFEAARDRV